MAGNENGGVRNEEVSSVQGVGRAMRLKTFSALALFFGPGECCSMVRLILVSFTAKLYAYGEAVSEIGGERERRMFCVHFPHSLFLCDLEPPLDPTSTQGGSHGGRTFRSLSSLFLLSTHSLLHLKNLSSLFPKMPHSWSAFPFMPCAFSASALLFWIGGVRTARRAREGFVQPPRGRLHVSARFSGFPGDGAWSPTPRSAPWCPSLTLPPSLLPLAGRPSFCTLARTHAAAARNRAKRPETSY